MIRRIKKTVKKTYRQLEVNEVTEFREELHKEQDMICPICGEFTEHSNTTLDHQHKLNKSEKIGTHGAGLIRGVLCRTCNTYEGKVWNNFIRLGFHKKVQKGESPLIYRADILRKMADYYDTGHYDIIHPTEKPKMATMGKMLFNRLNKAYKLKYPNRKALEIPKSAIIRKGVRKGQLGNWKITTNWENLLIEFDLVG